MTEEQNELMRIAAQSTLDRSDNGRTLNADAKRWALHWAQKKPLGRSLSDGAPVYSRLSHLESSF